MQLNVNFDCIFTFLSLSSFLLKTVFLPLLTFSIVSPQKAFFDQFQSLSKSLGDMYVSSVETYIFLYPFIWLK